MITRDDLNTIILEINTILEGFKGRLEALEERLENTKVILGSPKAPMAPKASKAA
jgi:hypothetical protein